jgi:predicted DNA-binding protein
MGSRKLIDMPPELAQEIKILAVRKNMPANTLIIRILQHYIEKMDSLKIDLGEK